MELNLRTLSKPLLAGIAALFVATPADGRNSIYNGTTLDKTLILVGVCGLTSPGVMENKTLSLTLVILTLN